MENIFVEFLPPWVETGLQPAFYDKESGTVLQQTARMYARVNMLIRMFNKLSKNTKETVEEYITKFNELYTYVHDYFDNLDVQEEINNKLDKMLEDGVLADIIDELWGTRIDDLDAFKDLFNPTGITTERHVFTEGDDKTDYYITYIPRVRSDGKVNELKQYLVGLEGQELTPAVAKPSQVAMDNHFAFCCNSATFITTGADKYLTTNKYLIQDGVLIDTNYSGETRPNLLCIMNDGTLKHYDATSMTPQELIDDGVKYSLTAFWTVLEDGIIPAEIQTKEDWTNHYQRQVIGQDADKNIYIFTCDGKPENGGNYSYGMTMEDVATIMLDLGCNFAFMLDGGGSTTTVVNSTIINQVSDEINRNERWVPFMLYVEDDKPESLTEYYDTIGQTIQKVRKEVWDTSCVMKYTKGIRADAILQPVDTVLEYKLLGSLYTDNDVPNDYKYSTGRVTKRGENQIMIELIGAGSSAKSNIVSFWNGSVWTDWFVMGATDKSDWTLTSTVGTIQYAKTYLTDKVANVCFQLGITNATANNTVIVSGLKGTALSSCPVIAWDNNNGQIVECNIASNGDLTCREAIGANASLRFNFSYIVS